jgi:hypothetical protein
VVTEVQTVADFSSETIARQIAGANGLFMPNHLLADPNSGGGLLGALTCPLWVVSEASQAQKMAVLVEEPARDHDLMDYAATLAERMEQELIGLTASEGPYPSPGKGADLVWKTLPDLAPPTLVPALGHLAIDLVLLPRSQLSLAKRLDCTCVLFPSRIDA